MTDAELRDELLRRMELDQEVRKQLGPMTDAEFERWLEIDRDNTEWLAEVVERRGWPLITQVGEDGAQAAWLLAQHADASPQLQRDFHSALGRAVEQAEASRGNLAYLEDRVRVNAGRPQLYGTQFEGQGDGFRPWPIEDPGRLDERRAEAGLGPFTEYEEMLRSIDRER
ncbi:DUF6624 domain-containing protein [Nonomuraea sp. NPDC050536]|uniref:DUF6624 domain-containing protein n=1 Tax=Nonomuraea sp. NPDC050536 TaxID=3364366 RepID=UPI0037C527CF